MATLLVLAAIAVPWMSPLHPGPLADWFTDTLTLSCIALAVLIPLVRHGDRVLTRASILAWGMAMVVSLLSFIHKPVYPAQSWMPVGTFIAMLLLAGVVRDLIATQEARTRFLETMAAALLLGAMLQALLGCLQHLGLANHAGFWIVHSPGQSSSQVMGNIAQRNIFAHVLALGAVSACYLHARGRLALHWVGLMVAFIGLIQSWCGARLVLAYGGGLIVLSLWWWLRARQDESVRRFCHAGWLAGGLMLGMQWGGGWIAQGLWEAFGIGAQPSSGFGRLLEVGLTERRWTEWAKALDAFYRHPLFGAGWGSFAVNSAHIEAFGNYTKSADGSLCLHAHNLVIQLLAETGIFGTSIALGGIAWCLWPCLRRANAESVFLLGLAMVILVHSQFEYPLWYLTGLATFVVVLACAAPEPISATLYKPVLRRLGAVTMAAGLLIHAVTGWSNFQAICTAFNAQPETWSKPLSDKVYALQNHPMWAFEADLVLAIHLLPYMEPIKPKLDLLERQASYRPYAAVLFKLALMRAINGDRTGAMQAAEMLIAGSPQFLKSMVNFGELIPEPAIQPVLERMREAAQVFETTGSVWPGAAVSATSATSQRAARP